MFLDEVGELPLDVQPKLLRVLESGEFRRVGGNKTLTNEARIVAATKRNLKHEVERGKFREDLYFRLAVVPITVPPLRTRREDIPALVEHFLELARRTRPTGRRGIRSSRETVAALVRARLARQRARAPQRARSRDLLATASGEKRAAPGRPAGYGNRRPIATVPRSISTPDGATARRARRSKPSSSAATCRWLLERHDGNISAAAREAKMDRKHLYDLARKHGLRGDKP